MKKAVIVVVALIGLSASRLLAESTYQGGNVVQITSIPEGLLIMLDTGVPDNCQGTPHGWLLIRQVHRTIVAVTLMAWNMKLPVTVYTTGIGSSGYGEIWQVDPQG